MPAWGPIGPRIVPEATHRCAEMDEAKRIRSALEAVAVDRSERIEELLYGCAFSRIDCAAGRWWAHNDEYSTPIRYCPHCGTLLPSEGA